jgi:mevalonate kinase
MDQERLFSGKILLFGEFSILAGSNAAVIPYRKVHARMGFFRKDCRQPDIFLQSFHDHLINDELCKLYIDTSRFERDINAGISLESTIPMNKGLGSSGAVCSLVYHYYRFDQPADTAGLRNLFSHMESWFHGKSSGIDPLCIYLNKPLVKKNDDFKVIIDEDRIDSNTFRPFLIDSGKESETRPLVNFFREQLENSDFMADFTGNYIPLVNICVEQWSKGELSDSSLFSISKAQLHYFSRMIPEEFSAVWLSGLNSRLFALKLCGSGGGGMILGFSSDIEMTRLFLKKNYKLDIIAIDSGEETVITN